LENNILTLGFPSEIVKKMMEKNDYLQVFQEILKQVFNEEILIRCVVLTGKQTTPFLLERVNALTGGNSLAANIELVLNNARLASAVAVALAALESGSRG
jgi:pseudouridine-5'-phosphate glycosidase